MLQKLLKYNYKSVKRFGIPAIIALAALIPISGFAGYFVVRAIEKASEKGDAAIALGSIFGMLLLLAFVGVLYVALFGVVVAILVDFYKSTATDEAYLTFTLPVTPKQIILSKLINSWLWQVATGLLAILAVVSLVIGIFAGIASVTEPGYSVGSSFTEMPSVRDIVDGVKFIAFVVEYVVTLLIGVAATALASFTAIFFGSIISKKHKALSAIGCMLGVFALNGVVGGVVQSIVQVALDVSANANFIDSYVVTYAVIAVYQLGMAFIYYFILKHLMTNRLNLA